MVLLPKSKMKQIRKIKMNKNTFKKRTYDHLQSWRDFHNNYEMCSTFREEEMKDIELKTNADGYQFHILDIDALYEYALSSLWGNCRFQKSHLKTLDAIIDGTTELFYEMTDCDIPNWRNKKSLLENLMDAKNSIADRINGVNHFLVVEKEVA